MDNSVENIQLQMYIAGSVIGSCILLIFILIIILFIKINRLTIDRSNQLDIQRNVMADFCYTNPTIVPGEELSRRGYLMYDGSMTVTPNTTPSFFQKNNEYPGYSEESRSQF